MLTFSLGFASQSSSSTSFSSAPMLACSSYCTSLLVSAWRAGRTSWLCHLQMPLHWQRSLVSVFTIIGDRFLTQSSDIWRHNPRNRSITYRQLERHSAHSHPDLPTDVFRLFYPILGCLGAQCGTAEHSASQPSSRCSGSGFTHHCDRACDTRSIACSNRY